MRMSQYYLTLMILAVGGLFATATLGIRGSSLHLTLGLFTACLVVLLHSLVILFSLISSRLLREAHENCGLAPEFLKRSNHFFRERGGFFLALAGSFSIVAAGVLGYGERAFGLSSEVHLLAGLAAMCVTVVAIPVELRALSRAEALLDEAKEYLDREDERRAERGQAPAGSDHRPYRDSPLAVACFVALAPLLIYLYQALIVWRGDFGRVSLHPWLEVCALGLVLALVAARKQRRPERNGSKG
jgi:hypothetical protein